MIPKRANMAINSLMGQRAPSDDVESPPQYSSAGDPSTSSSIVVASRSGNMVPVATPSSIPTNGVSVATALGPIRGLLDYYVRGEIPNPNHMAVRQVLGYSTHWPHNLRVPLSCRQS